MEWSQWNSYSTVIHLATSVSRVSVAVVYCGGQTDPFLCSKGQK